MLWRVFAQWFHGPPFPPPPTQPFPRALLSPPSQARVDKVATCCGQLSASRGSPSPTSPSPHSPGWGGGTLLETQSFSAQKPQNHLSVSFFWHYFTRLQDKLDFMRPIRTQTERRFAAEPWGQLCCSAGSAGVWHRPGFRSPVDSQKRGWGAWGDEGVQS